MSEVEQRGHSGTWPHARQSTKRALPRRLMNSTVFSLRASRSPIASASAVENTRRLPEANSAPMSTMRTAGSGCAVARCTSRTSGKRPARARA